MNTNIWIAVLFVWAAILTIWAFVLLLVVAT